MRSAALLALLAVVSPSVGAAHGHGKDDPHAAEELGMFYRDVTGSLTSSGSDEGRPFHYQPARGRSFSNSDPFSRALANALAHQHEDEDEEEDVAQASRPSFSQRLRLLPKRIGKTATRLAADAVKGTREYGLTYALYTGITEVGEHAAGLLFPPLQLVELNFVFQPAFFALARPAMTLSSIVTHRGSGVPLLQRIRGARRATLALMWRPAPSATDDATGEQISRREVRKTFSKDEGPIGRVARSGFWVESKVKGSGAGMQAASAGAERVSQYLGTIFRVGPVDERLRPVERVQAGFRLLGDTLSERLDSAFSTGRLTARQLFRRKSAVGSLGRLGRDLSATLATYATDPKIEERADHGPHAAALVATAIGLYQDADLLVGDPPSERLERLERGIADLRAKVKEFRRSGPPRVGRSAKR